MVNDSLASEPGTEKTFSAMPTERSVSLPTLHSATSQSRSRDTVLLGHPNSGQPVILTSELAATEARSLGVTPGRKKSPTTDMEASRVTGIIVSEGEGLGIFRNGTAPGVREVTMVDGWGVFRMVEGLPLGEPVRQ